MDATEAAAQSAKPILEFGRGWMVAPSTTKRAEELGLAEAGRFCFWVNGRAGVLGDVDPHIATAAIGFMAPAAVRAYWGARPPELSAWDAALAWFEAAAAWGRETLAAMDDARLQRLVHLAGIVIRDADLSIGTLFAGSALIPLPGDPAGDATVLLNVLRELRGGAHLAACHAVGLGPHATIMSTDDPVRGGASWAETFGWEAPHPTPDHEARAQIERLTTAGVRHAFAALSLAEAGEFVELCVEARAKMD